MKRHAALVALVALAVEKRAQAHEVGLSRGEYAVTGAEVHAEVVFARRELISLVATLDSDGDGALTSAEVTTARGAIEAALVGRLEVWGDGVACPGSLDRAELAEQDGVAVRATYRCPRRPRQIIVELAFLDDLAFGHRHLARAAAGAVVIDRVLSQRSPRLTLDLPAEAALAARDDRTAPGAASPFRRGALHALSRYEGAAFLLALLVVRASRRAAALSAVVFLAAILVGLGLGASGLFLPSPAAVTAARSLSLVYLGLDTLRVCADAPPAPARWPLALPFGVVHGLACAHVFRASGAPAGDLGAFALGVAAALGSMLVPLWLLVRRRVMLQARVAAVLGVAVAAAGLIGLLTGRT